MTEQHDAPLLRLEMQSQARLLAAARGLVHHFAQRLGFPDNLCGQISLAVDEALCNVINHGYDRRSDGPILISLWALEPNAPASREESAELHANGGVLVIIEDRARQVDPAKIKPRDLNDIRPGGLGVHIIREVMTTARYEHREGGGMRLIMTRHLPAQAADATGEACATGACGTASIEHGSAPARTADKVKKDRHD